MIHTVNLAQVAPQPWRNGCGTTQELLAWPSTEHWLLRISVARIDTSVPFSAFPGIERWFQVLQGAGVALRFDERRITLTAQSEPLCFDGGHPPVCELLDGTTQDLNLMLREDAGRGGLLVARTGADWHSAATLRAVFALQPATLHVDDAAPLHLGAGTLAYSEQGAHERWRVSAGALPVRAWWLHLTPASPSARSAAAPTKPSAP